MILRLLKACDDDLDKASQNNMPNNMTLQDSDCFSIGRFGNTLLNIPLETL